MWKLFKKWKLPDSFINATITPVCKKDDPTDNVNYRPVSVLPLLSKILEKVIYNHLREYMDLVLNKLLCGFRKAHSTQHALFKLLRSCQKELDNLGFIGTVLMNLSKGYDCLPHDNIIAKFAAYDVSKIRRTKTTCENRIFIHLLVWFKERCTSRIYLRNFIF